MMEVVIFFKNGDDRTFFKAGDLFEGAHELRFSYQYGVGKDPTRAIAIFRYDQIAGYCIVQ